jgi:hypothetical protein
VDREFECLRDDIPEVNLNTTAASEHVTDIDNQIRGINERMRAVRSTLPFKKLPSHMIIEMMKYVALWLNGFPHLSGVSHTVSPRTIMTGIALDFAKHFKIPFIAYVEAHEDYERTNTMAERTKGTICLGPTANFQRSYKLPCLQIARRVTRKQFKELPMPVSVIKRIAEIEYGEKQGEDLLFTDRNGNTIPDLDIEDDDIATTGVDTETGNETVRDDNQDKNETETEDEPFTTDDDKQPGIVMEPEEAAPPIDTEILGAPEGGTAGELKGDLKGETA